MVNSKDIRPIFLYTMTSGLGDYIVMGDLMRKVETLLPGSICVMAHRRNPHVGLWDYDDCSERFFDVYNPLQIKRLISKLRDARGKGFTVFGLQMAPGSVQGFFFHAFLKKIRALDYMVDFNLINADILIPPKGDYILDLHLNQIRDLLKVEIPEEFYKLSLPVGNVENEEAGEGNYKIGIHPWSRRGHLPCFVWPFEKWLETIKVLLSDKKNEIVILGRDNRFEEFKQFLQKNLKDDATQISFIACNSIKELIKVVARLDLLLSVNTSVVHIGYALDKKMVILNGPSLDLWTPKGEKIEIVSDGKAVFSGSDKYISDKRFPSVSKIDVKEVLSSVGRLSEK